MFFRNKSRNSYDGRKRARDGHQFLKASHRRRVRKASGLSNRQYNKVVKANRRYKYHGLERKARLNGRRKLRS